MVEAGPGGRGGAVAEAGPGGGGGARRQRRGQGRGGAIGQNQGVRAVALQTLRTESPTHDPRPLKPALRLLPPPGTHSASWECSLHPRPNARLH